MVVVVRIGRDANGIDARAGGGGLRCAKRGREICVSWGRGVGQLEGEREKSDETNFGILAEFHLVHRHLMTTPTNNA
jgi:hypothetical protein